MHGLSAYTVQELPSLRESLTPLAITRPHSPLTLPSTTLTNTDNLQIYWLLYTIFLAITAFANGSVFYTIAKDVQLRKQPFNVMSMCGLTSTESPPSRRRRRALLFLRPRFLEYGGLPTPFSPPPSDP